MRAPTRRGRSPARWLLALGCATACVPAAWAPAARAQDRSLYLQDHALSAAFVDQRLSEPGLPPSMNDWGETGLLQDPSARTGLVGDFNITLSNVNPYTRYNFDLVPAPWLELGFRYTAIMNRLYGPTSFSGNQRYKDRAFDIKLRLLKENDFWPDIALGLRDIAGTGLFSSQYLVASRRWYDLDLTAGIAWGNMASGSALPNPLGLISSHFKRPTSTIANGGAGSFNPGAYFTGPDAALFGGLEWQTPLEHLRVKLEYDPNDYQHEAFANRFIVNAPVNFAVEYTPWPAVTLAAGIERGKTGMLRLTVHSNFNDLKGLLPIRDVAPPPPPRPAGRQTARPAPAATQTSIATSSATSIATSIAAPAAGEQDRIAERIFTALDHQHLAGTRFAIAGHTAYLSLANPTYRPTAMALGRAARVVDLYAPPQVTRIDLTLETGAIVNAHLAIMRRDLDNAIRDQGSPEEVWAHAELDRTPPALPTALHRSNRQGLYPNFGWSLEPHFRQQVGGPNNFFLFQFYAALSGEAELRPGLTVTATYGANIYNDFNQLKLVSDSALPHVRSDIKYYLQKGANGIFRLQADQIATLAPNWYARASAGLLEEMFEGVDGEILYRPDDSRWAAGLDLNHVVQRGYDELFDTRHYQVTTGALTLYFQYSASTVATLSIGKYLAGDKGATFTLAKTFDSGITAGVFATKTNISAAQFGEGSFDKGFFLSLPLDIITGNRTKSAVSYVYRPLTRDGGQQISINKPLFYQVDNNNPQSIAKSWNYLDY
jgi:hypothetical protein